MGFPWAEAIGGAANLGSSALSAYFGWKHQKEVMQNRHQWEVADMRKAGLNPILSATGGSALLATRLRSLLLTSLALLSLVLKRQLSILRRV